MDAHGFGNSDVSIAITKKRCFVRAIEHDPAPAVPQLTIVAGCSPDGKKQASLPKKVVRRCGDKI